MPIICPTITAYDAHSFRVQMERIEPFAERIHIDLMDGIFAPTTSPRLHEIWWPDHIVADIHLMYQDTMAQIDRLIELKPNLVIIHQEALGNHQEFADRLHQHDIKVGIALLKDTPAETVLHKILSFDHVLVFSGDLGKHGGIADMTILEKVATLRNYSTTIEVSWDGGINDSNISTLVHGGVDVLNVGGFIQSSMNPVEAYAKLKTLMNE